MQLPRRWTEHLRRSSSAPDPRVDDLWRLTEEVEAGLRAIDFEEVTTEDRITFVEYAVAWQVRRALWCGRFDLALQLQRFGAERTVQLHERTQGRRSRLRHASRPALGQDVEREA